jgi:hypothetical protein
MTDTKPVLAYTVDELAASSGWSRSQIYEEIREGRLVAKKKGGKGFVVLVADAAKWLASLEDA